jgi:hypothetical protein
MREIANFNIIGGVSARDRNVPIGGKWSKSDIGPIPDIVPVVVTPSCAMEAENGPGFGCIELSESGTETFGTEIPIDIEPMRVAGKEHEPVVVVCNREVGWRRGWRFIFGMQEKSGARCLWAYCGFRCSF